MVFIDEINIQEKNVRLKLIITIKKGGCKKLQVKIQHKMKQIKIEKYSFINRFFSFPSL